MSSIIQTYPPPGWFLIFNFLSNLLSKIPITIKINKFAKTNQLTHQKRELSLELKIAIIYNDGNGSC